MKVKPVIRVAFEIEVRMMRAARQVGRVAMIIMSMTGVRVVGEKQGGAKEESSGAIHFREKGTTA